MNVEETATEMKVEETATETLEDVLAPEIEERPCTYDL